MEKQENSNLIMSGIRRISPQVGAAFFGALTFGLLSQGMGLFNKFSHHDDVANLFTVGTTVSSGRWGLLLFGWLEGLFYGTGNTSLPLFNGMISLLCISVTAGMLTYLFRIHNRVYCVLLGGIMAAFPVITALFAYMFTSHPYMIGLVMLTVCACLICEKGSWWRKLTAVCLGGAAVGIYQAFLPVLVTIILIYDILTLAESDRMDGAFWKKIGIQLLCLLGVMAVYMAGNRFFLNKYQVQLSAYQGIDQMGQMAAGDFLGRLGMAYREFFNPTQQVFGDMYPGTLHTVYWLMLALEGVLAVRMIFQAFRRGIGQGLALAAMFALIPLGCCLIYVMAENVHGIMVYGRVMQVVLFVCLFDRLEFPDFKWNRVLSAGASLVLAVMAVMYVRYDNQCYLKDALHQQEAISYFTTLITRIKSQPGYRPDMKVYFTDTVDAERLRENDPTTYNIDELDFIRLNPYWHNSMEYIHGLTRGEFMRVWCGADFPWGWAAEVESLPEVQAMPAYPADGSIQIINDAVVVKF